MSDRLVIPAPVVRPDQHRFRPGVPSSAPSREMLSTQGSRGSVLAEEQIRRLLGWTASSSAPLASRSIPKLVVRPAQVQGAVWNDAPLLRSDIRSDTRHPGRQPGVTLHLSFGVCQIAVGRCLPREGVRLELWHADAAGRYTDTVGAPSARHPGGYDTRGQDFLRGVQFTDAEGRARFTTIYPGAAEGADGALLAPRLHLRLQTVHAGRVTGEFSGPLFLDDALSQKVGTRAAYRSAPPPSAEDPHYQPELRLDVHGGVTAGLHAHLEIGLNV